VACDNWSPSLTFTVTQAFVQGDYLIKLTGPGNRQSYVPLTIWDPASTATYVIKNDVFTWQAWNYYGGYDYYQGLGSCPADVYPICSRARVVSYDRPYAAENGSANFLGLEYPLVKWAEQHGLNVTYATDLTVQEHPGYLLRHQVLLSLGHDECWSFGERQAAVAAYNRGVNLVFFAASPVLRHVRTQTSPLGPDRELVEKLRKLERAGQAAAHPRLGREPRDVLPAEAHHAVLRPDVSGQHPEQGGLARAVGSDQADYAACGHLDVDALQRLEAAEVHRYLSSGENVRSLYAHWTSSSSRVAVDTGWLFLACWPPPVSRRPRAAS